METSMEMKVGKITCYNILVLINKSIIYFHIISLLHFHFHSHFQCTPRLDPNQSMRRYSRIKKIFRVVQGIVHNSTRTVHLCISDSNSEFRSLFVTNDPVKSFFAYSPRISLFCGFRVQSRALKIFMNFHKLQGVETTQSSVHSKGS